MLRCHRLLARIHQQKTTGAICVLGFSAFEAGLSHQRRLLVAQNSGDGHSAQRAFSHVPINFTAGADLWQDLLRDGKRLQQLRVPLECFQVHQLGAARVGHVGDVLAGQLPQQIRINVAEEQLACISLAARAAYIFQQPMQLERAEISGERQPGAAAKKIFAQLARQPRYLASHAHVLPHNGIPHRLSHLPAPDHGRLALVGDPNRRQISRFQAGLPHRFADNLLRPLPYLLRVMLHPTRLRIYLPVFFLGAGHNFPCGVEHNETCARGSLIKGSNIFAHSAFLGFAQG